MNKLIGKKNAFKINKDYIAIYATIALFIGLFLIGSVLYKSFCQHKYLLTCSLIMHI